MLWSVLKDSTIIFCKVASTRIIISFFEPWEMAKIIPIKPKKKIPEPPIAKVPVIKKKPDLVKRPSKSQLAAEKSPTAG